MNSIDDLFGLSIGKVDNLISDGQQRREDAFFGDTVLKCLITEHLLQNSVTGVGVLSKKRAIFEANETLTYFLHCGTDYFSRYEPEVSLEDALAHSHHYGTVVEAMLWRSKSMPGRRSSLANMLLWQPVVKEIISWTESNLALDRIENVNLNFFTYRKALTAESEDEILVNGLEVAQFMTSISIRSRPRTIKDVMHREELMVMNVENHAGLGHIWSRSKSNHAGFHNKYSGRTWEGQQCAHCGAFNVLRKKTNQYSYYYIIGFKRCPAQKNWLTSYQDLLLDDLDVAKRTFKTLDFGKIRLSDLVSWEFLEREDLMMLFNK